MVEGIFKQQGEKMSEQNFKLSDDQNTLIIEHGQLAGEYAAKKQYGCRGCAFWENNSHCKIGTVATCYHSIRKDSKSIIWIKKENTEMTEAPASALQHRHFDLIVQWAKNPTQQIWMWSGDTWDKIGYPNWTCGHYAIGEKPTMPPVKMVKYNGGSIEFPEPARVELDRDKDYWQATIYGACKDYWSGHSSDCERLDSGLIQLTKEGAEKQSEALVELLKNHAQKWG